MLMPQQRCFGRSSGAAREELDGNRAWIFVPSRCQGRLPLPREGTLLGRWVSN